MQNKSIILLLIILLAGLVLISTACTPGLDEKAFQDALNTAIAETDTAQELDTQRTKGAEAALSPTETAAPTNTSIPPATSTLEPTYTPTPEDEEDIVEGTEQPEFTISGPAVQVSVDTNCRSGPGKVYTYLGALLVGEQANIYGKDPSGSWLYINNPDLEDSFCWIWGYYANTSGNIAPLPIYTPGPTPKPDPNFSVGFREIETCGGAWQVEFEIYNNGVYPLNSVSSYVQDTDTSAASGNSALNTFEKKTGCVVDSSKTVLDPGATGYTVSLDLSNDPAGHLVFASITLCTKADLNGSCRTRELYFTP